MDFTATLWYPYGAIVVLIGDPPGQWLRRRVLPPRLPLKLRSLLPRLLLCCVTAAAAAATATADAVFITARTSTTATATATARSGTTATATAAAINSAADCHGYCYLRHNPSIFPSKNISFTY